MAKLSRKNDANAVGGKIVRGARTVFANNIAVGLDVSDITSHGKNKHKAAKTNGGSPSVFAEGAAVLRVGSGTSCGHKITQGSPNVNVP